MSVDTKKVDKLYEFLRVLCVRLTGSGGPKLKVKKENGELYLDIPFGPTAVYAVTTALHDAGAVDFSMVITITVAVKEKPTVRVLIRPNLRSWIWELYEGESEKKLGSIVEGFKIKIEKDPSRTGVLARIAEGPLEKWVK